MCPEAAHGRLPGMMNPRRILTALGALVLSAAGLALAAAGAFGQGESLTDRLSFTKFFNSANCAIAGKDCAPPPASSPGSGTEAGSTTAPGRGPMPPRGKSDVGVFEFTVSGRQTTKWSIDD